ncbi:MAG: hypothetical protein KJ077_10865 [Anaerolineae bacterium]|nr:hypothetical protein [Anaerolineae bacterium]
MSPIIFTVEMLLSWLKANGAEGSYNTPAELAEREEVCRVEVKEGWVYFTDLPFSLTVRAPLNEAGEIIWEDWQELPENITA